jgi:hypothetical protein
VRWLLLLHQIPPNPSYFRAKVLRRISQVGALPVKNSAYLLPDREETLEDFQWIWQEITQAGGAAWLFRAESLAGMSSTEIQEAFQKLRAPDYDELIRVARTLLENPFEAPQSAYAKLSHRQHDLSRIDFFAAPARQELERLMNELERRTRPAKSSEVGSERSRTGKTWVTRQGVKIDRIGSAWLIKRFIDPEATFSFVDPNGYQPVAGEIRFDMLAAEFTHEGESCTFEVLISRHNLASNPALKSIGEIVHDIDLKEDRFQRPETMGIARAIEGLCLKVGADALRLERGGMIFDGLYESFNS